MRKSLLFLVLVLCCTAPLLSQKQFEKWYFGNKAGLIFVTNPPTILTNGQLSTSEGCSSICDQSGNLLFYTDGVTIWNKSHAVMANGTGLTGNASTTQSSMIIKQPGNTNIYFVFTLGVGGLGTLDYSIVDMNLAAGMGAVTTKNVFMYYPCTEKLSAVRHCNANAYWVLSHDNATNVFRAFLVDATGVNLTAVTSSVGPPYVGPAWGGNMKISPNGKKVATALNSGLGGFELFDFDNATGAVTNYLSLGTYTSCYGVEFSPDCSKLYGTREFGFDGLYQWDLCAGSPTAIAASEFTISTPSQITGMQLAPNGMIYVSRWGQTTLAVIQNPNVYGAGCNYIHAGQLLGSPPRVSGANLPNFITSGFKAMTPPFTSTVSGCTNVSFTAPPPPSGTISTCYATGYTVTGMTWDFDDPLSGVNNTSPLATPVHNFTGPGTYFVKLAIQNNCGADTLRQTFVISGVIPTLAITGPTAICAGQITTLSASGADVFTWSKPGAGNQTTTNFMVSPTVTTIYSVVGTNTLSGCQALRTYTLVVNNCTGFGEGDEGPSCMVYPNPANQELFVESEKNGALIVYDGLGSVVFEGKVESGKNRIDVSTWNDGVFFVKCVSEKGAQTTRLVLIK